MVFHKLVTLYLVLCTTMLLCGRVLSTSFGTAAIAFINGEDKTTMNYDTFCGEKVNLPDDQLYGCQLSDSAHTGVELRVCKLAVGCEHLVQSNTDFLDKVAAAELSVVQYNNQHIPDLKCQGEAEPTYTCVGYVEEWLDNSETSTAKPVKINERIKEEEEEEMIAEIKVYQDTADKRAITVTDLTAIKNWMTPDDDKCANYKQLCGLRGFFKKAGGFVIASPMIKEKLTLEDVCHSKSTDPTTQRVLDVLAKFIKKFTPVVEAPAVEAPAVEPSDSGAAGGR